METTTPTDTFITIHILLFLVNILFLIFSKNIINFLEHNENNANREIKLFRFFNLTFIFLQILDFTFQIYFPSYENVLFKLSISGLTIYIGKFALIFMKYLNQNRFGNQKEIDGKTIKIDTYSTRILDILISIIMTFFIIIILINYWGFDSLLETTGIFGMVLGFAALTSGIWAKDLISGLILLSGNLYSEGDIVEFRDKEYIIFKFDLFRTTLLDINNNHRTSLSNKNFYDEKLDNYTKLASSSGFRESLDFNIGYPIRKENSTTEERKALIEEYNNRITLLFENSFEEIDGDESIMNNVNQKYELFLIEAGDYALRYRVYFYINTPKSTNTTSKARKYLSTKHNINAIIFKHSIIEDVDLSTPSLFQRV